MGTVSQDGLAIKTLEKVGHYLFLLWLPHSRFSDLLELRFKPLKEQLLLQRCTGQALLSHQWFMAENALTITRLTDES